MPVQESQDAGVLRISPPPSQHVDVFRETFLNAQPFRHVVIDDFFANDFAERLLDEFPSFDRRLAISGQDSLFGYNDGSVLSIRVVLETDMDFRVFGKAYALVVGHHASHVQRFLLRRNCQRKDEKENAANARFSE